MTKIELRQKFLKARQNVSLQQKNICTQKIFAALFESDLYRQAAKIFSYVAMEDEVPTKPILQKILDDKKILAVPFIENSFEKKMRAVQLSSLKNLQPGIFRIETSNEKKFFHANEFDLILLPCVAVDFCGTRLGMGGGFYDRFLQNSSAKKIALVFSNQISSENLPKENFDVAVDFILCENGLSKIKKGM